MLVTSIKQASTQLKKQSAFEIKYISTCPTTMRHLIEVKINGKGQSISCMAEEIASDHNFLAGFPPADIRTITYLATSDKYEAILREEKIKKSYEIIRSKSINNKKNILIRNKFTGETFRKSILDFSDQDLIDHLDPRDAHHLGYLAGQEQTFRDLIRLQTIKINTNNDL